MQSVDQLDKQLEVTSKARKDANSGYPPSDQIDLGSTERDVRDYIAKSVVANSHSVISKLLASEHDTRTRLQISEAVSRIQYAPTDAQAELATFDENWVSTLVPLELEALRAESDYRLFQAEHELRREPHYPDSQIFHWSFIGLIALGETFLNGFFLATGSEWGLVGGVASALIITVINMSYAWIVGTYLLRQIWHRQMWRKVASSVVMLLLTSLILVFYLLIGHLRAVILEDPLESAKLAMVRFNSDPFGIDNVYAWILIAVSGIVAIVAIIKFLLADDLYPGYGKLHRKKKLAQSEVSDNRISYQKERLETVRKKEKELEVLRITAEQYIQKYQLSLNNSKQIIGQYDQELSEAQQVYSALINRYRSENRGVRPTPTPGYFDRQEKIPEEIIPPLDLFQFDMDEKRLPDLEKQYELVPKLYGASYEALNEIMSRNAISIQEGMTKIREKAEALFHHQVT